MGGVGLRQRAENSSRSTRAVDTTPPAVTLGALTQPHSLMLVLSSFVPGERDKIHELYL